MLASRHLLGLTPAKRKTRIHARLRQIILAAKSKKALPDAIQKPPPRRSHDRTRGGNKATATITPTKADTAPFIIDNIAATPDTKATMIK